MAYIRNYINPYNNYMNTSQYDVQKVLPMIKNSIEDEKEDEMYYDYLIKEAPTQEQKDIIASIRDDERKHNKMYRMIYKDITGKDVSIKDDVKFNKPSSYIEGIEKALFGELHAVEKYRKILREFPPYSVYRDMLFEIITDEIKHAIKYNYIIYLNCCKNSKLTMKNSKKDKENMKKRIDKLGENLTEASNDMVKMVREKMEETKIVENVIMPGIVLGIRSSYMGINKDEKNKAKIEIKQDLLVSYIGEVVGSLMDKLRGKVDIDKFMTGYVLPQLLKEN